MIQRIQSLYLLAVVVLLILTMCLPVANYVGADGSVSPFTNLGVHVADIGTERSCWGMFAILLLSTLVATATILLFRVRVLQIRMTIFNIILLIGYYLTFIAFIIAYNGKLPDVTFQLCLAACFPFVSIVLSWLAIRAIGKDEMLVHAMDRLR